MLPKNYEDVAMQSSSLLMIVAIYLKVDNKWKYIAIIYRYLSEFFFSLNITIVKLKPFIQLIDMIFFECHVLDSSNLDKTISPQMLLESLPYFIAIINISHLFKQV